VQGSLFIAYDYLGFKKRKLGFVHRFYLKNKLWVIEAMATLPHVQVARGNVQEAHVAPPVVRNLIFSSRFQSFFRLETPRNLK